MNSYTIWYEDSVATSKVQIFQDTKEKAIKFFKQFYKGYKFVGISK